MSCVRLCNSMQRFFWLVHLILQDVISRHRDIKIRPSITSEAASAVTPSDPNLQNTHVCFWVIWLWVIIYLFVLTRVGCLHTFLPMHPGITVRLCAPPPTPAQNRHGKEMKDWMNESLVPVSPLQWRAQESRSCVRPVLSRLWLVWPARLTVSPVLLAFTVQKQVSELQLDLAIMVSSCN